MLLLLQFSTPLIILQTQLYSDFRIRLFAENLAHVTKQPNVLHQLGFGVISAYPLFLCLIGGAAQCILRLEGETFI